MPAAQRQKGNDPDGLTARQRAFVLEYLKDNNLTQAAIRAGYSEKSASHQGSVLYANPKVAKAIRKLEEKHAENCGITREFVLNGLVKNYEMATNPETLNGAVANKALELMGKHLGLWVERTEVSGPAGGPQKVVNYTAEDYSKMTDEELEKLAGGE